MVACFILLEDIVENQVDSLCVQTLKLLKLVLNIPVTQASTERSISTLKRIKSYHWNGMKNKRLPQLAALSIEKELTFVFMQDLTLKQRQIFVQTTRRSMWSSFTRKNETFV